MLLSRADFQEMISVEAADPDTALEGISCVRARKDVPRSGSALCMSMGPGLSAWHGSLDLSTQLRRQ